jgi:pyrroline-5-carboxylate reductase
MTPAGNVPHMQLGLIGAGNMARAMARGWGDPVICSDHGSGRARALATELGGEALHSNLAVAERADVVVLCHKPRQLQEVAEEIASAAKAVASVLGGVTIAELQEAYPGIPVVRLMPNTPVEVRRGIVCYAFAADVAEGFRGEVVALLERLGTAVELEERLIEPASAVMGVGPAYQAVLAEAQIDAGVRHGLTPPMAAALVAETMAGTAALLEARGYDTLTVRREVASPGGSTARGLAALDRAGVRAAFHDAIDAVLGWSPS